MQQNIGYILVIVLMGCLIACQPNNSSGRVEVSQKEDSITVWIEQSKKNSFSSEKRKQFLDRALEAANLLDNDSLKTRYYSKLSLASLQISDSAFFRDVNNKATILAWEHTDSLALAEAQWDLAQFYSSYAIPDSSFYYYSQASKIYEQMQDDFMSARMLYNMAVIQAEVKDYTGSEINTIRAIELLKPLNKYTHLFYCYSNLGSITNELEDYDRAIDYYEQAGDYLSKIKEPNTLNLSLENNIGIVHQEAGRHEEAVKHFEKIINEPGLIESNPRLYARALNNMAYSNHKLDVYADLQNAFREAVVLLDSIQDWQGIARAHYNGAQYYRDIQDTVHAVAHASLSMEYALKSKNNKRLLETIELMVSLDPENAVTHTKAYIQLDDSLQKEERAIRNKFARIRFETDEFIAQNELLARQRQLWIGVAAGVFLLAFSVLIIIVQRIRNQRLKFQQQQQEANQEIFNLMLAQNQKLEEGKQSEQKRISEELHDGILGEMNGVRMVLLGLNKKVDEAAVALRSQAISKLQEIQEEIRTISHALSDASYRKFHNFVISLEELLKNIGDAAGIAYEMTYDEDIDWDALTGEVKINLYRIVQESLQNCVKHAQASTISLDLHGNSKYLEVTISDNGKGFSSQNGKKGIGQKNINSRVNKIGGRWNISSTPGKGTTVKVRVPYGEMNIAEGGGRLRQGKLQEV